MTNKKIIFAVDDEDYMCRVYEDILSEDYELHFFEESEEMLALAEDITPDLAIIDIGLPGIMNGYELCDAFKQKKGLEDVPVVFVTAHDFSEDNGQAFFSGGSEYVTKPIEAVSFLSLVSNLIQRYSLS